MTDDGQATLLSVIGVYDADGTLRGEVTYVLGHLIGRRECALCDITHSWRGRKRTVDAGADELGVPFDLLHRDEIPPELAAAATDLPVVLANTTDGPDVLLDRSALAACAGEPEALFTAVREAVRARGLMRP